MVYQLELAREGRTAVPAVERIDRAVEPGVHHQMLVLRKAFPTVRAHVRPLAGMELAVRYQVALQRERSAALVAHERPLARVHPRMGQQMVLQREALLALLALVRSLGRVQQQVRVETVLVRKVFAAVHAHVGPLSCKSNKDCVMTATSTQRGISDTLSPVWTRAWVVRWCLSRKDLPHWSHEYGRSFGTTFGVGVVASCCTYSFCIGENHQAFVRK